MKPNEDTVIRVRSAYGRTLEPGDAVFDEGDPGDHLYVIQSGEIELKREGPSGHHVVAQLGPGDFFGELSLVPGQRRNARAVAVKTTRVLQLDRDTLEAMCLAQPEFAMRMIWLLVSRLIEAGLGDQEVAAISGHQSMQMLRRYTHLRAEDLVERLDRLGVR